MSALKFNRIVSSRHRVEYISFSPQGHILAACFGDWSVRLYSSPTVVLIACFKVHTGNVWCLSFASNGLSLSSCSSDGRVIIYCTETLRVCKILSHHDDHTVWYCKYMPHSSDLIVTASEDCTIKIVSTLTGSICSTISLQPTCPIESLDIINCEPSLMCTARRDGTVSLWSSITSKRPKCFKVYHSDDQQPVKTCQFISTSDSCQFIVFSSPSDYHSIFVYRVADILAESDDLTYYMKLEGHCNIVWRFSAITIQHNKSLLMSCSGDRTVR